MSNSALRYQVIPESQSGHCCFVATVVDTAKPLEWPNGEFEIVCECFTTGQAESVARALNGGASA